MARLLSARPAVTRYLSRESAELLGSWGMLPVTRQARGQQRDATLHPSPDDLIRQARADVMADERTQPQRRRGGGRAR